MKKYDVVICGGGTSGVAAAYIAAKRELKTLIVEKNIHLGGTMTSSLVIPVMKSDSKNINCEFYTDFVKKMQEYSGQITYDDGNTGWFNPELAKIALDEMLLSVGCDILFDAVVKSVKKDASHLFSLEIESKTLSLYIDSKYFVDATGDANFSKIISHEFLEDNSSRQPMTLRFHVSGIDMESFSKWLLEIDKNRDVTTSYKINNEIHLSTACTWDTDKNWALSPIFKKAIMNGDLQEEDSSYFQLFTIPGMPTTISLNCPRIVLDSKSDPSNIEDFSKAMTNARAQIWRLYNFMKKYFVGFEKSYISNIADMAGVRESRRVKGVKIFTKDDILNGANIDNPVLHGDYPIDIHSHKKDTSTLKQIPKGYELPIECLKSNCYDNLFIIGRCLSADFEAQAALRVQKSCFSMGEAVAKEIFKNLS